MAGPQPIDNVPKKQDDQTEKTQPTATEITHAKENRVEVTIKHRGDTLIKSLQSQGKSHVEALWAAGAFGNKPGGPVDWTKVAYSVAKYNNHIAGGDRVKVGDVFKLPNVTPPALATALIPPSPSNLPAPSGAIQATTVPPPTPSSLGPDFNPDAAKQHLRNNPTDATTATSLAIHEVQQGNYKEASNYATIAKKYGRGDQIMGQLTRFGEEVSSMALASAKDGNFKEATQRVNLVREFSPGNTLINQNITRVEVMELDQQLQNGVTENAKKVAKDVQAYGADDTKQELKRLAGVAYDKHTMATDEGNATSASQYLEAAFNMDPQNKRYCTSVIERYRKDLSDNIQSGNYSEANKVAQSILDIPVEHASKPFAKLIDEAKHFIQNYGGAKVVKETLDKARQLEKGRDWQRAGAEYEHAARLASQVGLESSAPWLGLARTRGKETLALENAGGDNNQGKVSGSPSNNLGQMSGSRTPSPSSIADPQRSAYTKVSGPLDKAMTLARWDDTKTWGEIVNIGIQFGNQDVLEKYLQRNIKLAQKADNADLIRAYQGMQLRIAQNIRKNSEQPT